MILAAEIALLAVAAGAVATCLALLPGGGSRRARRAHPAPPPRPQQLTALEQLVGSAGISALQTHATLRPLLASIADQRLAGHGLRLERLSVAVAHERLGEPLWELIRPGRPFPEDRHAPGVLPGQLTAMLEVLERL